jgi:hypothetical protein
MNSYLEILAEVIRLATFQRRQREVHPSPSRQARRSRTIGITFVP